MAYAHCFRSGHIEVSDQPSLTGAICLAEAPEDELTKRLAGRARLGWDGTWLIPGIPEAATYEQAMDAVMAFREQLAKPSGTS
ncbi:host nuclease inhibitor protein [Ruegeria sp. HKCCD8929]|uniref:host nuclease inhibitor protein n=1 Tax=Ruegeria sp. HKCCD8929 TaxID=2683006 RepID=UPI001487FCA6|nr:host nuclease inhibitor protein [Ruegeria sp. HKCCD8929]